MKRLAVVLIVLALIPITVRAAENWTYAASEHFEVYTTAGAGTAREALNYFERVYDFYSFIFRGAPKVKDRTRLIIFSNDRQFAPYRPNPNVAAFYQSGADRDFIVMGRLDEDSIPIVVHEYSHLFLRHTGGRLPLWMNEGMAEVFSTMQADGGRIRYGDPHAQHLAYLRSGVALFDLNRLFGIGHDSPEYNTRNHMGVLYAQSWALVHMLHMDDRYEGKYWEFFTQVANGKSSADALMAVYGKTPAHVQGDLVNYIGRTSFSARATSEKKKAGGTTKYETRPAEVFEGSLVTANLRASAPDGEADARTAFQKLEQERPDDLALLESRAYFELRRGSRDAAMPYFERAVAQGTRNVKLLHDYSRLDRSKAAIVLPKALELEPGNVDVRIDHARQLLGDRKSSQTVIALSRMEGLSREQAFDRFQLLANAYIQLNQIDDGRAAATLARNNADSTEQLEHATRLLKSIDDYAEQRAKYEERVRASAAAGGATASGTARPAGTEPPPAFAEVPRVRSELAPPLLTDGRNAVTGTPSATASLILIDGRLRNIICLPEGKGLVLELVTAANTFRILVDNPAAVTVRGRPDGTVDLKCEKQDQPLTIGFQPGNNLTHNTEGTVRILDYAPQ